MKFQVLCFILMFCLLSQNNAIAQTKICKKIRLTNDYFSLDSLPILPNSVFCPEIHSLKFEYAIQKNQVKICTKLPTLDSITLCYQTLFFEPSLSKSHRSSTIIDTTNKYWDDVLKRFQPFSPPREQIITLNDFQKSGAFVRGVSLGNTQNVFVNSALNLQLEGNITEDISLTASISDQQVPYQPEGNTLQLQDIDRIFMQLKHRLGSLTAGNIVLQNKENYFLKFLKNTQGGLLETNYKHKKIQHNSFLGIAVARGKFASMQLTAIEGVQGPYRITGPNGERFIIVIANTEKIYFDGKLLQRGFDADYIIDYNLGEIIFNSKVLITRFTRLRIDFEYAERNYSRTILNAGYEQKTQKRQVLLQFYREADNPNNALIDLKDSQKIALSQLTQGGIGLVSSIDSVGFRPDEVLYKRIDSTTTNGVFRKILVYSTSSKDAFYRATFTEVGQNKGDYIRQNTTLNGQIFKWVMPLAGVPQGNFAPDRKSVV